jgi:hypothetical protein
MNPMSEEKATPKKKSTAKRPAAPKEKKVLRDKIIRVSAPVDKLVRQYAKDRALEVGEAADRLISTAVSRLAALSKYADAQPKKEKVKKPKKERTPKKKAATTAEA